MLDILIYGIPSRKSSGWIPVVGKVGRYKYRILYTYAVNKRK